MMGHAFTSKPMKSSGCLIAGSTRMRLKPRRVIVHTIIVLVLLALPLWLGSRGCGPVLHSDGLTAGISN